jgi:hypothetical protein
MQDPNVDGWTLKLVYEDVDWIELAQDMVQWYISSLAEKLFDY